MGATWTVHWFVPPLRGSITGWTSWGLHPRLLHATPPAFRTVSAFGGRRRFEPCHASGGLNLPSAFRTTFETLAYKPNSLLDSSSKKSTSLKGS